jgi:hypothetical protein
MSCFVSFFVRAFLRVAGQNLFIDQPDVSKKNSSTLRSMGRIPGPPESEPARKEIKEITFDAS